MTKSEVFDKLTALQLQVGYAAGPINMIALLGLIGEAGEVLEEWLKQFDASQISSSWILQSISNAIFVTREMETIKKSIRDKKLTLPVFETIREVTNDIDTEIADALYYINGLAINRNRTLDYYANLSYEKVLAKTQVNISHGINDLEMPKKSDDAPILCKECDLFHVAERGMICPACEAARSQ